MTRTRWLKFDLDEFDAKEVAGMISETSKPVWHQRLQRRSFQDFGGGFEDGDCTDSYILEMICQYQTPEATYKEYRPIWEKGGNRFTGFTCEKVRRSGEWCVLASPSSANAEATCVVDTSGFNCTNNCQASLSKQSSVLGEWVTQIP